MTLFEVPLTCHKSSHQPSWHTHASFCLECPWFPRLRNTCFMKSFSMSSGFRINHSFPPLWIFLSWHLYHCISCIYSHICLVRKKFYISSAWHRVSMFVENMKNSPKFVDFQSTTLKRERRKEEEGGYMLKSLKDEA